MHSLHDMDCPKVPFSQWSKYEQERYKADFAGRENLESARRKAIDRTGTREEQMIRIIQFYAREALYQRETRRNHENNFYYTVIPACQDSGEMAREFLTPYSHHKKRLGDGYGRCAICKERVKDDDKVRYRIMYESDEYYTPKEYVHETCMQQALKDNK